MPDAMNVLLYVNSFLPNLGGREFVVHHLASALLALDHSVRVTGPAGFWKHRSVRMPYPVHRWPTLRGLWPEQVASLQLQLDTALWGYDIIHAHNTYPCGYAALKLRGRRGRPVVITPHGRDINRIPEVGHGLRLDPSLDRKITRVVRRADRITAISSHIRAAVLEAGAPKDRVRLIPNGVDIARFNRPLCTDVRDWLGVAPDARLLITVGRYQPRKGFDHIVRAMPTVLATEPRARLVIVGDGSEALIPLLREQALENKVILTGPIMPGTHVLAGQPDPDGEPDHLAELLRSGELYLSAGISSDAEGLSLAVLEAMAARLPVVATAISGTTDVIDQDRNGVLVPPADTQAMARGILHVLTQPALQQHMREQARDTVSAFSWTSVAQRYVEVYEEALAERAR